MSPFVLVEFLADEVVRALEGGVVVVGAVQPGAFGRRSQQVAEVTLNSARFREYSTFASLPTVPSSRTTRSTSVWSRASGAMIRS